MVFRVYVEKKPGYNVEAQQLQTELQTILGISGLNNLRIVNRYDVEGISQELFELATPTIFSEPPVDKVSNTLPDFAEAKVFAVEYLPGQFDQRADSASECIQLISQGERPVVRSAKVYACEGPLSESDFAAIQHYVINPVEAREASLETKNTLQTQVVQPAKVELIEGFRSLDEQGLREFISNRSLAMDLADAKVCQAYFVQEQRDPTITEIKVIDTYWSDHCRHTTFGTELEDIQIDDAAVKRAFNTYLSMRHELGRDHKPISLMDMGTIGAKWLKSHGVLTGLDESEEINACTVKATVDVNGEDEDWLFLFKNETHNHPTEIEPFGGAATCIGGCIRDPLSGRSYVYQAMRVTGASDPRVPVSETLEGKLPQRKLVTTAAAGYSSYGNQIGLATGQVHEIYHPGYVAKRMEVGAVVGATPADHVRREEPSAGDKIILLGGRTGRDGIGGATGSSKAQDTDSLEESGAEVQKGNAPVERKLQRLFRRKDACVLIKRCNDFGAGGVSVATGEIADGLTIDLNAVPKKYEGLDGTELAISESQERMAVDVAEQDVETFLRLAREENLEASVIATVTDDRRMTMVWNGDTIVNLSREFLASNGASKHQKLHIEQSGTYHTPWVHGSFGERMTQVVTDINIVSNKGLSERFDSTIGASTVLMPFGGKYQLTPNLAMVAKLPVFGETTTASAMAWGFNPYIMEQNQFTGAYLSVVESLAKLVASGFDNEQAYLSFQEYFGKLHSDPSKWGKPAAAVLGALMAQADLGVGAIGGKDSMSGSFEDLDVPPTLISFAVALGNVKDATSPEFKAAGHRVARIAPLYAQDGLTPDKDSFLETMSVVHNLIENGDALAVSTPGYGASAEALFTMTLGNRIGLKLNSDIKADDLFTNAYGSFFLELTTQAKLPATTNRVRIGEIGITTEAYEFVAAGETLDLMQLQEAWEGGLEGVFPYRTATQNNTASQNNTVSHNYTADATLADDAAYSTDSEHPDYGEQSNGLTVSSKIPARHIYAGPRIAQPRVIIPVFPGNNCEYDSAAAFTRAGAQVETLIINNLSPQAVSDSTVALVEAIHNSQIIMLPGGFSGGDEPDGSAKFITSFFRAPDVSEAVRDLLHNRDGLMLGICNGFQALIKLGLVPYGDIVPMHEASPTLTFNTIGRHQSRLVRTRISSTLSPWLEKTEVGDIHTVAISHGEGRFVAPQSTIALLIEHNQIAAQYVNEAGKASMDIADNPNGSLYAIEGITSPDGRILGKMAHSERYGNGVYVNVPGNTYQPLFEAGVAYFSE